MTDHLVVDQNNELREQSPGIYIEQPAPIKLLAKVISYVFHPLFIPVYISWFLVSQQPHLFASFTPAEKVITIIRFAVFYTFFPLVTVLLARGLGFLDSIFLRTQKERIIPYIACGVYYFFMWYVLRNQPQFTREVVILSMAIWIASSLGLIANIYMKISMHAMSVGLMATFILLLAIGRGSGFGLYVSVALLITGVVCTARFMVSDHTQKEVYVGLLVGVLSQLIAYWAA
ncbi:MAG TPA: hypothetical protein VFZ42_05595 [Chitinophagaceae bacterium]